MTALHWAAFNGYFDVVKYLVEAGANVDAKNSKGVWFCFLIYVDFYAIFFYCRNLPWQT